MPLGPICGKDGDMMPHMKHKHIFFFLIVLLLGPSAMSQEKSFGGVKGKVRVETGSPEGVAVVVSQAGQEVTRQLTDRKGEFVVSRLMPGRYSFTFRKTGLSVGAIENVEVRAGKTRSLENLVLAIDEGSIAFIRGSVFTEEGRSLPNVRIELARIEQDGKAKKIDGRVTNSIGQFAFRLTPDVGKYRVTAKANNADAVTKDIEIDGAAVYRVALTVKRSN